MHKNKCFYLLSQYQVFSLLAYESRPVDTLRTVIVVLPELDDSSLYFVHE